MLRVFLVLFLAACSQCLHADEPSWRVGFASTKITPASPVRMAGYGSKARQQPFERIELDLFAKAMVIEDADGKRGLLITADLVGLTKPITVKIYERIEKQTGITREQIIINASHTHTGPVVGLDPEQLSYLGNDDHAKATIKYTHLLVKRIVDLASEAVDGMKPAVLSLGTGVATFPMNRREFTERGVRLGVNPRGLVDRSVPVLKIASPSGELRGVVLGAACHLTTLGGSDMQISGDYAGYAQRQIQQNHPGAVAMFVQGCGGDANPFPDGTEEISRVHGMTLAAEVERVLSEKMRPIAGGLKTLVAPAAIPLQQSISDDTYDKMNRASGANRNVAKQIKEKLAAGDKLPTHYDTEISLWQFGDDLTWVALPGEVVVDYVHLVERAIGPRKLWVSAYCHDVFGYLVTSRVLDEGGYEIRGIYSGALGLIDPSAEKVVVNVLTDLARQAGRGN